MYRIIDEALIDHRFEREKEDETSSFYIRESGESIRFVILHRLDSLATPSELNYKINRSAPESFQNNPAFKKNCDLICIHQIDKLSDFKILEEKIFEIEEDPHHFKKYILYFSDAENSLIRGSSFKEIKEIISDKNQFNNYKDDPLAPTKYSVAAKVFIKLPFIELPFKHSELISLRLQAEESVSEKNLSETYELIKKANKNNIEDLVQELIKHELENKTD
ncbi:ABC-three component system middle component 1 [Marinomonas fungiae]|uniref:Uncharacterized protein n=1 Tax=Marinomonas fungiae TaxID=1137284 RepID=A0A0K6ITR8_9GAMM|nr:ABC-three component system middle component 1 [Marinomonas fungiae]CUB06469.1 hypothetical protein Ga0061065_11831 [Marinomonas fungiae]